MKPSVLFGSARDCESRIVSTGECTFRVATVELNEPRRMASPSLEEYLRSIDSDTERNWQETAAWLRGRIERLFAIQQDPSELEIETNVDGKAYIERQFFQFGLVATILDHGFETAIPFVCSEFYGYPDVRTGDIPDRNGDRYHRLIRRMMTAFWQILFRDKDEVNDYTDTATVFGRSFQFGVIDGRPFSEFPPAITPK